MDRERLTRLLEEPGKVAREDIADLKALTEKFPWFSGAHLLRAVGEQAGGNVLADETLRHSAAHVPSRAVLFDLRDMSMEQAAAQLKESLPPRKAQPTELPEKPEASRPEPSRSGDPTDGAGATTAQAPAEMPMPADRTPEMPVTSTERASEDKVSAIQVKAENAVGESASEELQQEEAPHAIHVPEQIEVDLSSSDQKEPAPVHAEGTPVIESKVPEITGPAEEPVNEELERQILEAAVASVYDLTWQERVKEQSPKPPLRPQKDLAPVTEPSATIEDQAARDEPAVAIPPIKIAKGSRLKFTDWLSVDPTVEPIAEEPKPIVESADTVPDEKRDENIVPPTTPKASPAVDTRTLIDRFIEQENLPPVRKAEFFTPQQAAKKSLDDSAGVVSETLARIYEKQGNFQKASDAYRKLALKYPEKSAYFAALSKSLEGKSNT